MFYRQPISRRSSRRAGFSVLEYALVITAIAIGIIAAHTYLRRAVSSKWREAADSFGGGRQYKIEGSGQTVITPL